MITEKKYLAAKKIIEEYEEERVLSETKRKKREAEQIQKEKDCKVHIFKPLVWGKSMICQFCGKEV